NMDGNRNIVHDDLPWHFSKVPSRVVDKQIRKRDIVTISPQVCQDHLVGAHAVTSFPPSVANSRLAIARVLLNSLSPIYLTIWSNKLLLLLDHNSFLIQNAFSFVIKLFEFIYNASLPIKRHIGQR